MTEIPFVIFIMGPTATGKTDLAIYLHKKINSEIISVDSAMVYRGLDIGTAKPNKELLEKIPHRLIDICIENSHLVCSERKRKCWLFRLMLFASLNFEMIIFLDKFC